LNTIEQKFHLLRLTDELKTKYASHQLHGPAGIWWSHYHSTLPPNVPITWDQFKAAFHWNYIPSGLMAMKHTEFMRLTQGNKSLMEYLQPSTTLQGMQLSLWILMRRRLLVSSVASAQS
jgi:hypothetical protein